MGVNFENLGEEWRNGRVVHREPRLLRGFWLDVAGAVEAGAKSEADLVLALRRSDVDVNRAVYNMVKYGHLIRDFRGRLSLPKRVKRQLVAERRL